MFTIYKKAKIAIQRTRRAINSDPLISLLRTADLTDLQNLSVEEGPRSLNGFDALLLPQITKDFPDFDKTMAESYVRNGLKEYLKGKKNLCIHNIVIAKYERAATQKTIVYQVAASYDEGGKKHQKRYDIQYVYMIQAQGQNVAANCPNCGGAIGFGDRECPYCGSGVSCVMGNVWAIGRIDET